MDQLKEVLRQMILYRFWISVGLAALLPMIGYFVGAGPIKAKADTETKKIVDADTGVKKFGSGDLPNAQYEPIVATKTAELSTDVESSWRKLYKRQAPLLTWPERVQKRFMTWGRQWPKDVDSGAVRIAVLDYVNAYDDTVTNVYKTFNPYDPQEDKGVVLAPPRDALLRPAKFDVKELPDLGQIWSAQERLWIQRTLLEVVAQVNANAKNWDGAIIKQINLMEVGAPDAQDQRSLAKGELLEPAPTIDDPSKPAVEAAAAPVGQAAMMGQGGPGAAAGASETVSYIKTDSSQFKILPVKMIVLIEQDHMADFLVALANSPMTIGVKDFELSKPEARVVKPTKDTQFAGMSGYGGMMGGGMTGFGGNYSRMRGSGSGSMGMQGNMEMMMRGQGGGGTYGGMMGGGGAGGVAKKGNDQRSKDRGAEVKKTEVALKNRQTTSLHDPYFNVVEVTIYGQARFFNPPPEAPAAEAPPSNAPAAPADAAPQADANAPKAEGEPKAQAEKKAEGEPKAEAEKKVEGEPKAEAEKKNEPEKKAGPDAKSAEPKKSDAPKAEGSETPTPKADAGAPPKS